MEEKQLILQAKRGDPDAFGQLVLAHQDKVYTLAFHLVRDREEAADLALSRLEVDHLGLDNIDRRMLTAIIRNYGGGPVGLETLAATINEEAITLEDVYEPYLMQLGFLTRTPRGRCATPRAYEHLGLPAPGCSACAQEQLML